MVESNGTLLIATGTDAEGQVYQVNPAADETLVLAKVDAKQPQNIAMPPVKADYTADPAALKPASPRATPGSFAHRDHHSAASGVWRHGRAGCRRGGSGAGWRSAG